ncbi:MAG: S8 family peptidase [Bacteroidales bacterium]|nr:S8 family peptidase [Bacteroidales bacterium]
MKKVFIAIIAVLLSFTGVSANHSDGRIKINIVLKSQSDVTALSRMADAFPTKAERRDFVVNTLKRQAKESQYDLLNYLNALETNGVVDEIRPLWIVNSVSCMAEAMLLDEIAQRDDVLVVYQCVEFRCLDDDEMIPVERGDGREIAENLLKVNADKVWELGYTGEDVLIAVIDTGVNLEHADLQGRLWDGGAEYPNHGYDFYSHDNDPSDGRGHGTHVAGTIVGTGASGTQTGVAPGAKIMALKVFNDDELTETTMWVEAMQFAVEHGADILNMSLGQPMPDAAVKLMMRQACDNTLAAGVVAAVCAGNVRQMQSMIPIPYNIYSPGDCPPPHLHEDQLVNAGGTSCVVCVGAVDFNDAIAAFSSVGPSVWTDVAQYNDYPYSSGSSANIGLIRPDVSAPGVNIKSLDYSNNSGYCLKNGTSMATPCVAGTMALMLSKDHELTPAQLDEILERTAISLSTHKSNDFGSGRIDALAAVNAIGDDGVVENEKDMVSIYPNPAKDFITIVETFPETSPETSQISLINIDGQFVGIRVQKNNQIYIGDLPNGIYLMKIESSEGVFYEKIIKE